MCWTCFKFTYRPCEFSQAQASASLGSSMDGQLNRIRESEEERERFLIAHNSCALIVCVSSYCVSKTDPMTKKTFYRPEGYPVQQGEMQPDLSNYLFFVQMFHIGLRLKQGDQENEPAFVFDFVFRREL